MTNKPVQGFSFTRRNPGHWDVYSDRCRIFALRGAPGCYFVRDEREEGVRSKDGILIRAKSIETCVQRITEELMFELIIAESQDFTVIERWNIT